MQKLIAQRIFSHQCAFDLFLDILIASKESLIMVIVIKGFAYSLCSVSAISDMLANSKISQ